MQELKQGTKLQDGRYIIKRVLGQGGFGITYLAEQVSLGRDVAIKEFFMKENCVRDGASGEVTTVHSAQAERYHDKFLKEARTLSDLRHQNIIKIIDVFKENGTAYYVMPYMSNGSLKDLVNNNGRLQENVALRYTRNVAQALKYMHEKRLCHFDVKPANIVIDTDGNAVLIDFGISKHYDENGEETSSTPVGLSDGFAPIEQYQQMVNEFSPASDVYALGATLYYLVMGQVPPSAINIAQGDELALDLDLSYDTRNLIEMAMRTSSKQRLQNVDRFLSAGGDPPPGPELFDENDDDDDGNMLLGLRNYWEERKWWIIAGILALLGILCYVLWQGQQHYSSEEKTTFSADSTIIDSTAKIAVNDGAITTFKTENKQRKVDDKPKKDQEIVNAKKQEEPIGHVDNTVFKTVDQMPQYPGGEKALMAFLRSNIHYPQEAAQNNIQGKVVVQFVVEKSGEVGEVKVVRSVSKDLDNEAIRLCKLLPRFVPGRQGGNVVRVWYTLPVTFKLQSTNSSD